jgi:hypothetical protein
VGDLLGVQVSDALDDLREEFPRVLLVEVAVLLQSLE